MEQLCFALQMLRQRLSLTAAITEELQLRKSGGTAAPASFVKGARTPSGVDPRAFVERGRKELFYPCGKTYVQTLTEQDL
jgi:hypothetical protein